MSTDGLPYGEILRMRDEDRARRKPRLPQDYPSVRDWHQAKYGSRPAEPQTTANRGYDELKRR